MTRYNCEFDFFYKNVKTAEVTIKDCRVYTKKYTDEWWQLPFGFVEDKNITRKTIDAFFESRCFPKHRADKEEQLEAVGLKEYDAFKICLVTGGRLAGYHEHLEFRSRS